MILYISLRKWVSFSSVTFISGKHLHKSISIAYHVKAPSSSKKNTKNCFRNAILKSPFISFNNIFPSNTFYHITFFMLQYTNLSLTSIFRSYVQMNLITRILEMFKLFWKYRNENASLNFEFIFLLRAGWRKIFRYKSMYIYSYIHKFKLS